MELNRKKAMIKAQIESNEGILRLVPSWVTRTFLLPGKRLKLDIRDMYPRGASWGAVSERWMASTGMADNGPTTGENEGLSFIAVKTSNGIEKILLKDAIEILGDIILGDHIMNKYGGLVSFAKFYDFSTPIPHHVHLGEQKSAIVGATPKPEAYYFPVELNSNDYNCPHTYFGLEPGTTRGDIIRCLKKWDKEGDNGILEISRAYRLKLGTGWDIPAGILHAPGSLVTYEPQRVSDTSLFFQSMVQDRNIDRELLVKFVPSDKHEDYEYLVDCLDWEANIDPEFKKNHYREPIPVSDIGQMEDDGYREEWIVYGSTEFCAKKLTVFPKSTVTIKDVEAYGLIMMEGYGTINGLPLETPVVIRYEQITCDEYFVTYNRAKQGVTITNLSDNSNIVMLKHFGPGNKDSEELI